LRVAGAELEQRSDTDHDRGHRDGADADRGGRRRRQGARRVRQRRDAGDHRAGLGGAPAFAQTRPRHRAGTLQRHGLPEGTHQEQLLPRRVRPTGRNPALQAAPQLLQHHERRHSECFFYFLAFFLTGDPVYFTTNT